MQGRDELKLNWVGLHELVGKIISNREQGSSTNSTFCVILP